MSFPVMIQIREKPMTIDLPFGISISSIWHFDMVCGDQESMLSMFSFHEQNYNDRPVDYPRVHNNQRLDGPSTRKFWSATLGMI
jgi:hypothetical protein